MACGCQGSGAAGVRRVASVQGPPQRTVGGRIAQQPARVKRYSGPQPPAQQK